MSDILILTNFQNTLKIPHYMICITLQQFNNNGLFIVQHTIITEH